MDHYDFSSNHLDWFLRTGYRVLGVGKGFGNPLLLLKGKKVALFKSDTPIFLIEGFTMIHHDKPGMLGHLLGLFESANPTLDLLVKKDHQVKSFLSKFTKSEQTAIKKLFGLTVKRGRKSSRGKDKKVEPGKPEKSKSYLVSVFIDEEGRSGETPEKI